MTMLRYVPLDGVGPVESTLDELNELTDTSDINRMNGVDTTPNTFMTNHNDLPILPNSAIPPRSKVRKPMTTLKPKKNCMIHYRSLK